MTFILYVLITCDDIMYFAVVLVPNLDSNTKAISVLTGESVTVGCNPDPDRNLELQWSIVTRGGSETIPLGMDDEGSADMSVENRAVDDEDATQIADGSLKSRIKYQSPFHQLILFNTTTNDSGSFTCKIKPPPNDNADISLVITFNVLPSKCLYLLM